MDTFIIIIFVIYLHCAGFASYIASEKGRNPYSWFFLGLFFGIFALIAIASIPSISNGSQFYSRNYMNKHNDKPGLAFHSWECSNCHQVNGFAIDVCSACGTKK
jgi:hypothetical protein